MAGNELGRARISMMARSISSNTRPDTLVRDHRLQSHDFPLQRTAGPYIGQALSGYPPLRRRHHSRARASLRNRHIGPSIMGFEDEVEQSLGRRATFCANPVSVDVAINTTAAIHLFIGSPRPPLIQQRKLTCICRSGCTPSAAPHAHQHLSRSSWMSPGAGSTPIAPLATSSTR